VKDFAVGLGNPKESSFSTIAARIELLSGKLFCIGTGSDRSPTV
jgi:hypothetical protein